MSNIEIQLRAEAQTRKNICLYVLEKKLNKQVLITDELKKIAPDIFVFQRVSTHGGMFEYEEMVFDQVKAFLNSFKESACSWDETFKSLLTELGFSKIEKLETNFSRKPTGFYLIEGIFLNNIPLKCIGRVGTE